MAEEFFLLQTFVRQKPVTVDVVLSWSSSFFRCNVHAPVPSKSRIGKADPTSVSATVQPLKARIERVFGMGLGLGASPRPVSVRESLSGFNVVQKHYVSGSTLEDVQTPNLVFPPL